MLAGFQKFIQIAFQQTIIQKPNHPIISQTKVFNKLSHNLL